MFRFGEFIINAFVLRLKGFFIHKPKDDTKGELSTYRQLETFPKDLVLHKFLSSTFHYYQLLRSAEQLRFRKQLYMLLKSKWFAGQKGLEVSDSMILVLGATMVQLSFGLKHYYFHKFNRIVVFPDVFYSHKFQQDLKGLTVYNAGAVLISWPHFEQGFVNPSDKLNLGLHEFAHALYLDYFGHKLMKNGYSHWIEIAHVVFNEMQIQPEGHFLRKYAATNIHEFWAVCVEHFFEASMEFKTELPQLYEATSIVLKQDMAQRELALQANS